jgi:hypothetical protein
MHLENVWSIFLTVVDTANNIAATSLSGWNCNPDRDGSKNTAMMDCILIRLSKEELLSPNSWNVSPQTCCRPCNAPNTCIVVLRPPTFCCPLALLMVSLATTYYLEEN